MLLGRSNPRQQHMLAPPIWKAALQKGTWEQKVEHEPSLGLLCPVLRFPVQEIHGHSAHSPVKGHKDEGTRGLLGGSCNVSEVVITHQRLSKCPVIHSIKASSARLPPWGRYLGVPTEPPSVCHPTGWMWCFVGFPAPDGSGLPPSLQPTDTDIAIIKSCHGIHRR